MTDKKETSPEIEEAKIAEPTPGELFSSMEKEQTARLIAMIKEYLSDEP